MKKSIRVKSAYSGKGFVRQFEEQPSAEDRRILTDNLLPADLCEIHSSGNQPLFLKQEISTPES